MQEWLPSTPWSSKYGAQPKGQGAAPKLPFVHPVVQDTQSLGLTLPATEYGVNAAHGAHVLKAEYWPAGHGAAVETGA